MKDVLFLTEGLKGPSPIKWGRFIVSAVCEKVNSSSKLKLTN